MNFKFYLASAAATVLGLMAAVPANAASLTASDVVGAGCVGQTTCTVNGFTLTAGPSPYEMTRKMEGGILGIGVAPDAKDKATDYDLATEPSQGEIDHNESLSIDFAETIVTSLQLSFMYLPPVYADEVFELANVTASNGLTGTLQVLSSNSAKWIFNGVETIVSAFSPSETDQGGSYIVYNPFGDLKLTGLSITGNNDSPNPERVFAGSDLAFTSISTVPEPGTVAALAGLAAVGGLGLRRRKSSQA